MNSPKVSVIIPVYNVDHYLEQCVNSILGQSFGDFELILVDDGSKDQSGAICDEYEKKDVRVKVIHQQNAGSSAARNTGLKVANGIYILFVDADDWVDSNHIESMVETAERESADVVFCGFFYEYPRKRVVFDNRPQSSAGRGVVIESFKNRLHAGVQYKLIQRSLLVDNQLSFPKYGYYEDMYCLQKSCFMPERLSQQEVSPTTIGIILFPRPMKAIRQSGSKSIMSLSETWKSLPAKCLYGMMQNLKQHCTT